MGARALADRPRLPSSMPVWTRPSRASDRLLDALVR